MTASLTRRALMLRGTALAAAGVAGLPLTGRAASIRDGKVFTTTNGADTNEVLVFDSADDGTPGFFTRVATGGAGTGAGLGSQGALALSGNRRALLVVNAGSNTVSAFALAGNGIVLTSVADAGGLTPTSVTERHGLVYVLNAGGNGSLHGFRLVRGVLVPIAGSERALSAAGGTAPAQVSLSPDGRVLVVTERNTNLLSSYPVRADGTLGERIGTPSPGATPFGFAFTARGHLVVSEAAGGATDASSTSSYRFDERAPAAPLLVSRAVPTTQTAACWVATTPDGRHAYVANAGSSSVSHYSIGARAALVLQQAQAALTGPDAGALDLAVSADGARLHVLASRALQLQSFDIGEDGGLTPAGSTGGLITGVAGLVAT